MSIWMIISWVLVVLLTAINIVVFLQLKKASEQMLKMAFPGAKNMNEALTQMQSMMGGMNRAGMGRGGNPFTGAGAPKNMDAQLKTAMDMLQQIQKSGGKKR